MMDNEQLSYIAQRHFGIETLESRNSDGLDFHTVSVWALKRAIQNAYEMGLNSKNK